MKWTQAQDEWLIANYAERPTAELAEWLHRSLLSVKCRANKLGLRKSPEFADKQKRTNQFKPGHVPFNKGRKRIYWATPEGEARMQRGMFKPGECRDDNPRKLPIGHERLYADGYVWIITPHGRMQKHRWVWMQANGPIPKGYCIQFKDGNRLNCSLDNLYIIHRSKQYVINRHHNKTPERLAEIHAKQQKTRNASIRRDKLRLKWGLEPEGKLVKRI